MLDSDMGSRFGAGGGALLSYCQRLQQTFRRGACTDLFLHRRPAVVVLRRRRLHGAVVHCVIGARRGGRVRDCLHAGGDATVRGRALQRRVVWEGAGDGRAVGIVVGALGRAPGVRVGVRISSLMKAC